MPLSSSQKEMRERITKSIEREIGMCDSYNDLIVLASILWESAKRIFTSYAKDYGEEALEQVLADRKANQ